MTWKATRQQRLFVDEYLRLRKKNATTAAINAGYSERSAQSQSSQLLVNPNVVEYLKYRESKIMQELQQEFMFDAIVARKVMYKILNDDDARDQDKINVAKDLLDRGGFKPTEKVEMSGGLNLVDKSALINKYMSGED